MFNAKTFLRQATLALALACSSLAALAGPAAYHVNIDTTGRSGTGFLDLLFNTSGTTPVTATVRNFSGAFDNVNWADQVTFNPDGSVVLSNLPDAGSYLLYDITMGAAFSFDIFFSDDLGADAGEGGSRLSIAVGDADGMLGEEDGLVKFDLKPGAGIEEPFANAEFAQVDPISAAVPEPSDWLLMASGLALLGASLRRRMPR